MPSVWEDYIRMELKEMYISTSSWVDLARDRDYWRALVNAVLSLWFPKTHGVGS